MSAVLSSFLLLGLLFCVSCGRGPEESLVRAADLEKQGKLEDAALEYQKAIQSKPDFAEAHYLYGMLQLRQGDGSAAFQSLLRAAELSPDRPAIIANLADIALAAFRQNPWGARGMYNTVQNLTEQHLKSHPDSTVALRLKGRFAIEDQRFEDAVTYLEKARAADLRDSQTGSLLAIAYLLAKQDSKGETLAKGLIARKQATPAVYDALYNHYLSVNNQALAQQSILDRVSAYPQDPQSGLRLASHYLKNGKTAEAEAALQEMVRRTAPGGEGPQLAADFLYGQNNSRGALAILAEAIRLAPQHKTAYEAKGLQILGESGRVEEAISRVSAALASDPQNVELRLESLKLRLASAKASELASLQTEAEKLLEQNPNSPEALFTVARIYGRAGDTQRSIQKLKAAVSRSPDSLIVRLALVDILLLSGSPQQAIEYADQATTLYPRSRRAQLGRAASLIALGKSGEAKLLLDELRASDPQDSELRIQQAFLALSSGQFHEAEQAFGQLVKAGDNLRAVIGLAQTWLSSGQPAKAYQFLQTRAQGANSAPALRALLAECAYASGRVDDTIRLYRELSSQDPAAGDYHLRLANLLREKGEVAEAEKIFRAVLAQYPANPGANLGLALVLESQGQMAPAEAKYREVLRQRPDDVLALNNLAYLLADSGRNLEEAGKLVEKALAKRSGDPSLVDTQAWIYLKRGRAELALPLLNGLVKKLPQSSTLQYHLGTAWALSGEPVKAKQSLQAALSLNPSPLERSKIQAQLETINR